VDGLEQQYGQQISFERVHFDTPRGQALARRYQVRAHPAIVVLNADGNATLNIPGQAGPAEQQRIIVAIEAVR
jgi:thioredoxin-related protein